MANNQSAMPSKIIVRQIDQFLSRFAPPSLAEEWDNVGLQVGNPEDPVTGILVSLDVTEAVLWEAVEHDANLIITHHPLFFQPVNRLDDLQVPTRLARLATQMGINILSFHTNLDSTRQGLNDQLAKVVNLTSIKPLIPSRDKKIPNSGLGRIGKVPKTTLDKFLKLVTKNLHLTNLRYVGDPHHPIICVAVMTGSGGGFFLEAQNAGADVLITGDVKYHHALDALGCGIALIDIGHFAGEIGMVPLVAGKLREYLRRKKAKLKIIETKAQTEPFQFLTK
jgi:dinuclear metal center YbgI/SA1388 family protein